MGRSVKAVTIKIHDVTGNTVKQFPLLAPDALHNIIYWDGTDDSGRRVAGGVYFYRLRVGDVDETRRMVRRP